MFRRNPAAEYRVVAVDPATQAELVSAYFIAHSPLEAENQAAYDFGMRGLRLVGYQKLVPTGPSRFDLRLYFRLAEEARPAAVQKPARPKPPNWYRIYQATAVQKTNEQRIAEQVAPDVFDTIVSLWQDSEVGPWLDAFLTERGYSGYAFDPLDWEDAPLQPNEFFPLAERMSLDDVVDIVHAVVASEAVDASVGAPKGVALRLIAQSIALALEDRAGEKPRLVLVPKDVAAKFIKQHHSALAYLNPLGLLYTFGVRVGKRLVAVATVNTPSGPSKPRPGCPKDGMVELSRIASDGSTLGASSMLAARALDLLPVSGRRGVPGCLFFTYSLLTEKGTTYLALVDKGLRPVGITNPPKTPSGARKGSVRARATEKKIIWEAGPAAKSPNWNALKGVVPDDRIAAAAARFEAWQARQRRSS